MVSGLIKRVVLFGTLGFGSLLMQRKGITYHNKFYILTIYNIFASLFCIYLLRDELGLFVRPLDQIHRIILFLTIIIFFVLGGLVNGLEIPRTIINKYPHTFIFNFDHRYMITKISDVLFQQVFVLSLLSFIRKSGANTKEQGILFGLIFFVLHFAMLLMAGKIAFFHISLSLIGSVIFAFLILSFKYGFVYAFIYHLLGYLVFRVLIWAYYVKFS